LYYIRSGHGRLGKL